MRPYPVRWKSVLLTCLALALLLPQAALSAAPDTGVPPNYAWHTFFGSGGADYNISIAVDADGNSYLTGRSAAVWLGPVGQQPLHAYTDGLDVFVLKLDSHGNYLWHTFYGSDAEDRGFSLALDAQKNVYVSGFSAASWQGSNNTNPLHDYSGGLDAVVLKLTGDGAYQWHTFYGAGAALDDRGYGIVATADGDLYLTGFSNGAWLGHGNAAPIHPYNALSDLFALKLSSSGVYVWHTFYGGMIGDSGYAGVLDSTGALYLTGRSDASWLGDGNTSPRHTHVGNAQGDMLVLKLSSSGAYQWHTFYGGSGTDQGTWIAISPTDDIYLSGVGNAAWLGDGSAAPLHPYTAGYDLEVLKLSSSGDYRWHTFYGSASDDFSASIALDGLNPLVIGYSAASWQGDGNTIPLHPFTPGVAATDYDLALLAVDQDGAYGWHTFYGSSGEDRGTSVAVSLAGPLHIAGYSNGSWQGDGSTAPLHSHTGGFDLLVMQFNYQRSYLPLLQK